MAKQWCPLCLTVQGVLLGELIWSVANLSGYAIKLQELFGTNLTGYVVICVALPVIWLTLKPVIQYAKEAPVYKSAYKRLLYNPETFHHLLQQQSAAPDGYQNLGITIGNPEASNTIIKVCNPYCGPCAKAHEVLHEILRRNKSVRIKIIFSTTTVESKLIVQHFLALSKDYNAATVERALDEWYFDTKKEYNSFNRKYPINDLKNFEREVEMMNEWYKKAEINGTPTFFINQRRLPQVFNFYQLRDLL